MTTVEDIVSFDYLYDSMRKCRINVSWKASVQSFLLNDIDNIIELSMSLKDGTYKEQPQKTFKVYEPKERDITSLMFVDRVYQRCLADNLVYPQMTKSLIYDNVACQHGKGTDFGRRRLKCHMQKHFKEHGLNGWVLQTDIKGYYPNMSHDAVIKKFRRHLDIDTFLLVEDILSKFDGERGYYAGSQMIQIAGITLLDDVDHYAKEQLRIKRYLRYMDDTIMIAHTKEQAQEWLSKLENEYAKVGCSLNKKKTRIYPLSSGITFLGFNFRLTDTGKVIQVMNREKLRRKKVKYNKMLKRMYFDIEGKSKVSPEKFDECITAFMAHLKKGDSFNIAMNFRDYIEERKKAYDKEINAQRRKTSSANERNGT